MKHCKTIAEYAIKKWMEDNNFVMTEFSVDMDGNEAVITDKTGDSIRVRHNQNTKEVEAIE